MISLINHDSQWGRSEVVIICPDKWWNFHLWIKIDRWQLHGLRFEYALLEPTQSGAPGHVCCWFINPFIIIMELYLYTHVN